MSLVKTEVQAVGRDTSQIELQSKVANSEVKQVQEFVYLGGTICSNICKKKTFTTVCKDDVMI